MNSSPVLQARSLSKWFGGVHALTEVNLSMAGGSVLALLGENGAGKSTFIGLASGALYPSAGTIEIQGHAVELRLPADGLRAGVAVVHQDPKLVNDQSIAANIFATELSSGNSPFRPYQVRRLNRRAVECLRSLGLEGELPRVTENARALSAPQRQLVAIAKALTTEPAILFLDEPTASLTSRETERLWRLVDGMRSRGVAVAVVSHRLREVYEIADRVAVLRDGRKVGEGTTAELPIGEAVRLMAPTRRLAARSEAPLTDAGREVLRLEKVSNEGICNVNLVLHAGEVVGMAGLVGAGRTEIARAIGGIDKVLAGHVYLDGKLVHVRSPRAALKKGIALTNEERPGSLFPGHSVSLNATASVFDTPSALGFIRRRLDRRRAHDVIENLNVKGKATAAIGSLSGGNQQKVLIGRVLATEPRVLVLDEPTHGIDVATKAEIYELVKERAASGVAILFISSELEEIFEVADRIVVVRQGTIVADLPADSDALSVITSALGEKMPASQEVNS
jgi:ABC-type sugar transport system ATPase subunit